MPIGHSGRVAELDSNRVSDPQPLRAAVMPTRQPCTSRGPHFSVQAFGFLFSGPRDAGTAWEGFMPRRRGNLLQAQRKREVKDIQ